MTPWQKKELIKRYIDDPFSARETLLPAKSIKIKTPFGILQNKIGQVTITRKKVLEVLMEECISKEYYEKCAIIRDILKIL